MKERMAKYLQYIVTAWLCLVGIASSFLNQWISAPHLKVVETSSKLRMSSSSATVTEISSNKYVGGPNIEGPGQGRRKTTVDPYNPEFKPAADFGDAYPNSSKCYKVSGKASEFVVQGLTEINYSSFCFR